MPEFMTTLATSSTLAPSARAETQLPSDGVWRQILASRRAVIGGGAMLVIILTCVLSLPWTGSWNASTSPVQYNEQHGELVRLPPPFAGRPSNIDPPEWAELQRKLREHEQAQHIGNSLWRWFGTDVQARSLLGRCLFGGVISLLIGFAAATISVVLGVTVGLLAGYRGGWVDATLMRIVDILYGLPYILLVILFRIAFQDLLARVSWLGPLGANLIVLFLAIGLVSWLTMARVIRGQVLSLRSQPFVEAARAAGVTEWRIFFNHLLPNLVGPIIVYTTLIIPSAILQESFLSFLGVGIQPPLPTWGSLASDGLQPALNTLHSDWWLLLFPCTLLAIMLLCLNFLGDGLRDVFDPKKEASKI